VMTFAALCEKFHEFRCRHDGEHPAEIHVHPDTWEALAEEFPRLTPAGPPVWMRLYGVGVIKNPGVPRDHIAWQTSPENEAR
jgi:hypothetical protein